MPRPIYPLLISAVLVLVTVAGAWGQKVSVNPWPPNARPQWTPIPQVPGLEYAPNLPTDVFRYQKQYFFLHGGKWYYSRKVAGPWQLLSRPPQIFSGVEAAYFKHPPGWAKGKKTGWSSAPLPPGQMKKFDREKSIPPGQMKKISP
ncbi:MAG: hypothetical protein AB1491_10560 [Thermodesulfobacteriota bacterium]